MQKLRANVRSTIWTLMKYKKITFISILILTFLICFNALATEAQVFKYYLDREPTSLDTSKLRSSGSGYFFNNMHRSLYKFDEKLQEDLAESCNWTSTLEMRCRLKKDLKWSDGSKIIAGDFVRSFRHLIDPKTKALRSDLVINLKNALQIIKGQLSPNELGVKALGDNILLFSFASPDPDWLYKLSSTTLSPIKTLNFPSLDKAHELVVSGPYKISSWERNKKINLVPNLYDKNSHPQRPKLEIYFINDDSTALNLYETGKLSFLKRISAIHVDKFKSRSDFHQIKMIRFDYLGFGEALKDKENIRKALSYAIDYNEFKKIYGWSGLPGCSGLPSNWYNQVPCIESSLTNAQKELAKTKDPNLLNLKLIYSEQGGENHKRAMQWLQNHWQQKLKLFVNVQAKENKLFLNQLRNSPPEIFRKGIGLDRPTCLAALETFTSTSLDNFIKLKSSEYDQIVSELAKNKNSKKQKVLCQKGLEYLINHHLIIPLGPIYFSILMKSEFTGWKLNALNQLDLSQLRLKDLTH